MKNQTNSTVQAAANLATVQREQVNALNPHAHEICIKPAADSLAGLPKVDIFRDSLAAWMKSDQPKLTQEVGEVVVELNTQGSEQDALTEQTELLVSLDGGQTFSPAPNGVRIIYKNVFVPGEDEPGELHMNATSEGVISDLWVSREEHLDHNLGTSSALVDDILERLVDDSVLESDNAEEEILPGAVASEVREIMMQDIVGDYDVPEQVPEWSWVERNACFAHTNNGTSGIWEFILNLSREMENIPEKLQPVISKAVADNMAYLIFHQGT